ncbi:ABC transporter permease [Agromyces larvae]|uniref:ABC transporter permease n=1 Tax=Agromyces larvae TaxID=2929802 RepID=A0ABY4C4M4_9MICO|nr:ABC transporter permease [Agromyces larvae]UOE44938.1 ABC transporter permease [Agromyces larvae]
MSAVDLTPQPGTPAAGATRPKSGRGGFGRYLLVRFLLIFPTIFILVTLVFFLMRLTGDPITAAQGGRLGPAELEQLRAAAGFDRPVLVQYFEYIGRIFVLDFGTTYTTNRPVIEVLLTYGPATFELVFYSLIVAFAVGIPLGLRAAYHRDKPEDAVYRVLAIWWYAVPVFFAGLILKLIFSVWLKWFPVAGRSSVASEIQMQTLPNRTGIYTIDAILTGDPAVIGDVLSHVVLPAITLGLLTAGIFLRLVRTNVIGTLSTDYVDAARSRGVRESRLLRTHAYRPALIPIITVIGLQIALLLGGAVLTETTFEWRGLGFQLAEFLENRDFIAVQGIVALLAVIVAVTNFVVDIIAAFIDPRVRY